MDIYISRLIVSVKQMDVVDLKFMCEKHLNCASYTDLLVKTLNNGCQRFEYKIQNKLVFTVDTNTDINNADADIVLDLKSDFFSQNRSLFDMNKFLRYLHRNKHEIRQISLNYVDTDKCLSADDIVHWLQNSDDHCLGSLVKWCKPRLEMKNGVVNKIRMETNESKTNYGQVIINPYTKNVRFTLTVKKIEKIRYVLESGVRGINPQPVFTKRCLELLISCIDFITPETKKTRISAKYVRQPQYKAFIAHDALQAINWSSIGQNTATSVPPEVPVLH